MGLPKSIAVGQSEAAHRRNESCPGWNLAISLFQVLREISRVIEFELVSVKANFFLPDCLIIVYQSKAVWEVQVFAVHSHVYGETKKSKVYLFGHWTLVIYLFNAGKPALKSVDTKRPTAQKTYTHMYNYNIYIT